MKTLFSMLQLAGLLLVLVAILTVLNTAFELKLSWKGSALPADYSSAGLFALLAGLIGGIGLLLDRPPKAERRRKAGGTR
jgi:uncharacterized metal-binding protein